MTKSLRNEEARRLAALAGVDLAGGILPPGAEGGIDRGDHAWLRRVLDTPFQCDDNLRRLIANPEPWPHFVYYHRGRATYVPPDRYMFRTSPPGPSDCTWIVPGTLEKQL